MNILLLGNGFDLAQGLPTKYIDFLCVMKYLKHFKKKEITIGEIFSNKYFFQKEGTSIPYSYKKYKEIYDWELLNRLDVENMKNIAIDNMWLNYFLQSFDKNVGWIDFEKEINKVLDAFHLLFEMNSNPNITKLKIPRNKNDILYIINSFGYFWDKKYTRKFYSFLCKTALFKKMGLRNYTFVLKEEYKKEDPLGSFNYVVDREKVLKKLFESLQEFSKLLNMYFRFFVERPFEKNSYKIKLARPLKDADCIVTLNYTRTYENIIETDDEIVCIPKVLHIHGSTDSYNIVLGVNTDKDDEIKTIDTSFIFFKKYYQRVVYRTDLNYIEYIQKLKHRFRNEKIVLRVYGHSLDITDRDIIIELFDLSTEIIIYYHSVDALGSYINNLVTIFGKKDFDKLRDKKNMKFIESYKI